jgi:hypothetical protein
VNIFKNKSKEDLAKELETLSRLKNNYIRTFSEGDGKLVLEHMFKSLNMTDDVFDENVNRMYFRAGQRSLLLSILRQLGTDFEKYKELLEDSYSQEF